MHILGAILANIHHAIFDISYQLSNYQDV